LWTISLAISKVKGNSIPKQLRYQFYQSGFAGSRRPGHSNNEGHYLRFPATKIQICPILPRRGHFYSIPYIGKGLAITEMTLRKQGWVVVSKKAERKEKESLIGE